MTARGVVMQTRPARTPTIPAQQVRGHAALVEEDVLVGVVQRQPGVPVPALGRDVSAPLFVGVYGFF